MSARGFLDTNILIYSETSQSPDKARVAQHLIVNLARTGRGLISYQVVHEFFNVVLRNAFPKLNPPDCQIVLASILAKFPCVPNSQELVMRALGIHQRYKLPWYDALIVAAALEADCTVLFSEDFQAGQVFEGSLTVVNPFAA
jgi:predicted nucleic acid-binding protein